MLNMKRDKKLARKGFASGNPTIQVSIQEQQKHDRHI